MGYTDCFGIDISDEQISYAKTKLGLSNIEKADALDWLEGKNMEFDCILAIDILEHLDTEDLLKLAQKMFVALKPGGIIIIHVPNGMSPLTPFRYGDLTHIRAFTAQSMQQLFLYAGLVPLGYYETPPYIHGIKSFFQRIIWSFLFKPVTGIFVRIAHGRVLGGDIYTGNFIAVAMRKQDQNLQN
jgi:2-polyprenyl-3-methyl-5-hydroxy-6-metoxy-1,4-benzoquinol methylase